MRALRLLILLLAMVAVAADSQGQATTLPSADPGAEEMIIDPPPTEITTAAGLLALTPEQAAARIPVRIRGVVTYVSGNPPLMFVQDATGGACIFGPRDREAKPAPRVGSMVDVVGITAAGRLAPYITARPRESVSVEVVGSRTFPTPRAASLADLATAAMHGQWVTVEATIRAVRTEQIAPVGGESLVLTLGAGGHRLDAVMLNWPVSMPPPTQNIGAVVRLRGVFNAAAPERIGAIAMRLLVPMPRDLRIIAPATPPFEMPLTPITQLGELLAEPSPQPVRVRMQGIVTLALPGRGLFLESEDSAVWVDAPAAELTPGERIDIAGFLGQRGWAPALEDPTWQVLAKAVPPSPPLVTADQAFSGRFDARRVQMEALVLSVSRLAEGPTLVLQSGEKVFLARLASPEDDELIADVGENAYVRLTGVCINNRLPEPATPAAGASGGTGTILTSGGGTAGAVSQESSINRPVSFHLLLDPMTAVQVIRAPSWWTLQRVLIAGGLLASATLVAFVWAAILRRRVAKQTDVIRVHVAREAAYEERVRIARELHDSVGQDLLGIAMQLNATEKLLAHQPNRAQDALTLASAMVRRSQAETHRAIWDLREGAAESQGLPNRLREAVAAIKPPPSIPIEVHCAGESIALPGPMENQILRVALEALTNALKHSAASRVWIALSYDDPEVTVTVSDDGKGFDTAQAFPLSAGHFGLFGMRERAEKIGAELRIDSEAGRGTTVSLRATAPKQPPAQSTPEPEIRITNASLSPQ